MPLIFTLLHCTDNKPASQWTHEWEGGGATETAQNPHQCEMNNLTR